MDGARARGDLRARYARRYGALRRLQHGREPLSARWRGRRNVAEEGRPRDVSRNDRSFVSDIGASADDETITSAIIALAHSLDLQVMAEGVETATQLDFLKKRACHEIQGYFFAQPLPRDAIPNLLQRERAIA
jgi:EAL domain